MLIAGDNAEFNSSHQQDALEYLQWVFDRLEKEEPKYGESIPSLFNFKQTNQLVCVKCNGYKQINEGSNEWKFPVPHPTQQDIDNFNEKFEKETDKGLK